MSIQKSSGLKGVVGISDIFWVYILIHTFLAISGFVFTRNPVFWASLIVSFSLFLIPFIWTVSRRFSVTETFALRIPKKISRPLVTFLLLFCGNFFLSVGLSILLIPLQKAFPSRAITVPIQGGAVFSFISVALLPAICEEFTCRGFIYFGLRRVVSEKRAIILSALLFALLHPVPASIPVIFIAGLTLGHLARISGSVFPSILMHFCHNALLLGISIRFVPEMASPVLGFELFACGLPLLVAGWIFSTRALKRRESSL